MLGAAFSVGMGVTLRYVLVGDRALAATWLAVTALGVPVVFWWSALSIRSAYSGRPLTANDALDPVRYATGAGIVILAAYGLFIR